jgi:hypothetical protein
MRTVPARLLNLRDVPDDEVEEILELLTAARIDHYVTPAGNWGISAPAIWLHDKQQLDLAKRSVDRYQQQRFARVKKEYEQMKRDGTNRTILDVAKENPVRLAVYVAAAAVIGYLSIAPFVNFGN